MTYILDNISAYISPNSIDIVNKNEKHWHEVMSANVKRKIINGRFRAAQKTELVAELIEHEVLLDREDRK